MTLSMVEYFFSPRYKGVTKRDGSPLFEDLAVWEDEEMRSLQGTVPVISITLSGAEDGSKEQIATVLSKQVQNQYVNYEEILINSPLLSKSLKKVVSRFVEKEKLEDPPGAFVTLCKCLNKAFGKEPILLLDEYDTPYTEAFLKGSLPEVADTMSSFLVQCFKDNHDSSKSLLAGITRIGPRSLFSDFNNPVVDTMLDTDYPVVMGYTEEEVKHLLENAGLGTSFEEVKKMYGGYGVAWQKKVYSIDGQKWLYNVTIHEDVYNPYSVNKYLEKKKLGYYWNDKASSGIPKQIITGGSYVIREQVVKLLSGEDVWTVLPTNLVFEDLYTHKAAALSFLFFNGYLTAVAKKRPEGEHRSLYKVKIPNKEVREYYRTTITEWLDEMFSKGADSVEAFCMALCAGASEKMTEILGELVRFYEGKVDAASNRKMSPESFILAAIKICHM